MFEVYSGMSLYSPTEKVRFKFDRYEHPSSVQTWDTERMELSSEGTHYGFVSEGTAQLECDAGCFELKTGMYFVVPGAAKVQGGQGYVCCRLGYEGMFSVGGPIEKLGRLRYIDGCSDTVLVGPPVKGDPCMNFLRIPANIDQTAHTHPTIRVGMIIDGKGYCQTDKEKLDLVPGKMFVLHANQIHSFHTQDEGLRIVIYHPDSDSGPSHDDHPMVNRTIVGGISASGIAEIRTRKIAG